MWLCTCCSDVLCGQLHCTRSVKYPTSFLSSMLYLLIDSYITVGPTRYECDSAVIDVGTQSTDPALAPDGAKCGDGKVIGFFVYPLSVYLFVWLLLLSRIAAVAGSAYCYRRSSVVCVSVCVSLGHVREPCKNGWTDRDTDWRENSCGPKEPLLDAGLDPQGERPILGVFWTLKSIVSDCCVVRCK